MLVPSSVVNETLTKVRLARRAVLPLWDGQLGAQPSRNGLRESPLNRDRFLSVPRREVDVSTVDERRSTSAWTFLLGPYEKVNCDATRRVLLDVLTIPTRLARPILTLPLELCRTDEVVLVLELAAVCRLIE